jgi:hypothetical protein
MLLKFDHYVVERDESSAVRGNKKTSYVSDFEPLPIYDH